MWIRREAVHPPGQVALANSAFVPSAAEIEPGRRLLACVRVGERPWHRGHRLRGGRWSTHRSPPRHAGCSRSPRADGPRSAQRFGAASGRCRPSSTRDLSADRTTVPHERLGAVGRHEPERREVQHPVDRRPGPDDAVHGRRPGVVRPAAGDDTAGVVAQSVQGCGRRRCTSGVAGHHEGQSIVVRIGHAEPHVALEEGLDRLVRRCAVGERAEEARRRLVDQLVERSHMAVEGGMAHADRRRDRSDGDLPLTATADRLDDRLGGGAAHIPVVVRAALVRISLSIRPSISTLRRD